MKKLVFIFAVGVLAACGSKSTEVKETKSVDSVSVDSVKVDTTK